MDRSGLDRRGCGRSQNERSGTGDSEEEMFRHRILPIDGGPGLRPAGLPLAEASLVFDMNSA
jgi:hypothetical protein